MNCNLHTIPPIKLNYKPELHIPWCMMMNAVRFREAILISTFLFISPAMEIIGIFSLGINEFFWFVKIKSKCNKSTHCCTCKARLRGQQFLYLLTQLLLQQKDNCNIDQPLQSTHELNAFTALLWDKFPK